MSREIPIISPTTIPFPLTVQPVVSVFTQTGEPAFPYAEIMSVIVKPESEVPEHPVETGAARTDFIIYKLVELEMTVILRPEYYQSTYENIKKLFYSGELLNIQTKVDYYKEFILSSIPHDETPEYFDTIAMVVKFKEFKQVTTVVQIASANPSNSTSINRGAVQAKPATDEQKKRVSAALAIKRSLSGG